MTAPALPGTARYSIEPGVWLYQHGPLDTTCDGWPELLDDQYIVPGGLCVAIDQPTGRYRCIDYNPTRTGPGQWIVHRLEYDEIHRCTTGLCPRCPRASAPGEAARHARRIYRWIAYRTRAGRWPTWDPHRTRLLAIAEDLHRLDDLRLEKVAS